VPYRVRPLLVSGQLACAHYRLDADSGRFVLAALNVLTVRDGRIAEMNAFLDPATQRWFGLPDEVLDEMFSTAR
jgi:hypothetical protein